MVELEDIGSIEIDMKVYRNEKIIIKNKKGIVLKIITPKPGRAEEVFKTITSQWMKKSKG